MSKINQNNLARKISESEGLKEQISIAQIKEVLKITLRTLGDEWINGNEAGVIDLLKGSASDAALPSEHPPIGDTNDE